MVFFRQFIILISLLCCLVVKVYSQEPLISVSVSPNVATVGDVLVYKIQVETSKTQSVVFPELKGSVSPFNIYSVESYKEIKNDLLISTLVSEMRMFEVGDFFVPTQSINLSSESGMKILEVMPVMVSIKTILSGAENQGARDLKPLMELAVNWISIWLMGGFVLFVLALIGFSIYWFYFRRSQEVIRKPVRKVDLRPIDVVFKEKIGFLKEQDLIQKGNIKTHYFLFSDIMKEYFSLRYKRQCQEMTSQELFSLLDTCVDDQTLKRIKKIFHVFDLSKYTTKEPDVTQHQECFDKALEIIDRTTLTNAL